MLDLPRGERSRTRRDAHGPRDPRIRLKRQASSIAAFSRTRGSLTAGAKAISSPATSAQARSRSIADFSCASSPRVRTLQWRSRFQASGLFITSTIFAGSSMSATPARSTSYGPITPIITPIIASCRTPRTSCCRRASIRRRKSSTRSGFSIANGETPSLFFRFPGLISSDPLMQAVSQFHLVTLGADAWLALGRSPGAARSYSSTRTATSPGGSRFSPPT